MIVAIGSWHPNGHLAEVLERPPTPEPMHHHYLYAEEQKLVVSAMSLNTDFIIAQAIRGCPSKMIAAGHGVSREAIDKRLRPIGLKNPPGVRGRPKPAPLGSTR